MRISYEWTVDGSEFDLPVTRTKLNFHETKTVAG
jgi:hypothetical protein